MGYVYMFVFPNGKKYVGATTMKNPKGRWLNGKGYSVGTPVRTAIDEFGWRHVTKLCCEVLNSELDEQERYWIAKYKTTDPEFGYNSQSGGKRCYRQSEDDRRKKSESCKGKHSSYKGDKNPMYGRQHTAETLRKMSEAQRLRWAKKKGLV